MDRSTVQRLLVPEAFPHPVGDIQLIETHISWVILTGDFAYKIKKPIDLGFLDFRELERRQYFCNEELALNRRYTPEIYLELATVNGTIDTPQIDGSGVLLDYAVKMQQFDTDCLLAAISQRGELNHHQLRSIARELAKSHRDFPALTGATKNPGAMEAAMFQNFEQAREYAIDEPEIALLDTLERWTRMQIKRLLPLMQQRVRDGHIKDLHGDLHLNNMVLLDGQVRFFDCIEFNKNFRLMDTIAEIAFLTMDLADRGEPAQQVLNDYLEYSGDYAGLPLLQLYRTYFAMVRAKVSLMHEPLTRLDIKQTQAYRQFRGFVELALTYTQEKPQFLALMHGVAGSGKSTVARHVAEHFGAIRLRSDVERKRLFGLLPDDSSDTIQNDIYTTQATAQTFEHLRALGRDIVHAGLPCIIDATFLKRATRRIFVELAQELDIPLLILECIAPADIMAQRVSARTEAGRDASEAGIEIMQQQLRDLEPFVAAEREFVLTIDTQKPFEGSLVDQFILQRAH